MKRFLICFVVGGMGLMAACSNKQQKQNQQEKTRDSVATVNVIFDTDMGPDYDDVGAITLLHYYENQGKANILATMASTKYPRVAAVLNVLNTYFKKPDIPIGVPKGDALTTADWQHWSDTLVAKYPHKIKSNDEAPDAVKLYRKILSVQPDSSVTIITVGFFNNIADLLKSKADEYSPLTGPQLIEKKVIKMVSMAGKFPSGREFNVDEQPAASKYVFENFNKPIIFSGYEIGAKIFTGLPLINPKEIKNSPVQDVFRISIPMADEDSIGRKSWDQTAVLVGVNGHEPYYKLQQGTIKVTDGGENSWVKNNGNHYYLIEKQSPKEVEKLINDMMMYQPK
ncbi:nucleoside hydrolase [Mucilaginibacter limnophilus]|uniref:Nucleoside hydrolase n=1 Tax=Mucilaginibacter limnophilus TaxID=1932778 RepID=A0A3S2VAZ9_9SPHI|nr:nucleoside hydrolase [Mucilaginibacter limnophilus]